MSEVNIRSSGEEHQITIKRLAQITVSEGELTIDLANPSLQIVQEGARLTIGLNPRLGYVAPEERGSVAEDLGLDPYEYVRLEDGNAWS